MEVLRFCTLHYACHGSRANTSEKTRLNAEHGYFCIEFLDLIEMRDQVYLVIAKSKYFNLHCAKTPNLEKGALCTDQEELVSVGNDKKMASS